MDGDKRRKRNHGTLKYRKRSIVWYKPCKEACVSRQVIVQDIALLRATNRNILSTNRGYMLYGKQEDKLTCKRVIAVKHTDEQMRDELYCIVDAGAKVLDVIVEHELYGQISVDLFINSRRDVDEFMEKLLGNTARPLKERTGDIHFHTIEAESDRILDLVEEGLKEKQFLIS